MKIITNSLDGVKSCCGDSNNLLSLESSTYALSACLSSVPLKGPIFPPTPSRRAVTSARKGWLAASAPPDSRDKHGRSGEPTHPSGGRPAPASEELLFGFWGPLLQGRRLSPSKCPHDDAKDVVQGHQSRQLRNLLLCDVGIASFKGPKENSKLDLGRESESDVWRSCFSSCQGLPE